MEYDDYCFKCGERADYEIEVKVGKGESIATKSICESCLINLIAGMTEEDEGTEV